jgi:periplasmic protein TonB
MSNLVDSRPERSPGKVWSQRAGLACAIILFMSLVTWAGLSLSRGAKTPNRQIAKIALLPDTPPPPPPPPEKPKIEPKNEIKQQIDKPKMETPPEPQQLKMEGQAGEGPSPFAAGEVKNDYIGGDIGNGERFASYVGRVAQLIQDELTRHKAKVGSARVLLWLAADGAVQRFEIRSGSADTEREIRTTMADFRRVPEGPPQDMPMPMGLEISEH